MEKTNKFMLEAIKEAKKAELLDEVPVGCVIVLNDKVIARAHNQKEKKNMATAHAEVLAIQKASKKLGNWCMNECELFVTLEPCMMCAMALIHNRISRLYFSEINEKEGALVSKYSLDNYNLNHHYLIFQIK